MPQITFSMEKKSNESSLNIGKGQNVLTLVAFLASEGSDERKKF